MSGAGRRAVAGSIGLAFASTIVALVMGEAVLALRGYHYSPLKVLTSLSPGDRRYEHVFQSADFEFDPQLIWRPVAGRSVFNSQGFRGREVKGPKAPGEIRILAVGDSNTLGHRGERGANWALLLEAIDPRLRVMNAAAYGYSSFQGLHRLQECLWFEPNVALISFGANDAHPVLLSDAEYARRLARRQGLVRILTWSRLGQLLMEAGDLLAERGQSAAPQVRRVDLAEYRDNLTQMVRICRRRGVKAVLLTRPYTGERDPRTWKILGPHYNQATREVAAQEGVALVDLFKLFKRKWRLFEDESHFTPGGHTEAAQAVYEQIRSLLDAPAARPAPSS